MASRTANFAVQENSQTTTEVMKTTAKQVTSTR